MAGQQNSDIMQKAISSAREALQHAAMHEQKGLPASASTILTIEMVKLQSAYKHFTGQPNRNMRILEDVLQKCQDRESNCRANARRQMQTYGLLYKQGHFRKNWQTRLFILSGGQLKYYVPGDTEAKGTIYLHQITSVQAVAVSQHGFKIETSGGKIYMCQAPDAGSLEAWVNALRPLKVGFLMKQGHQVQQWKKRWCMLWRTQLAFFESQTDNKDRKSYVLLRDVIDGNGSVSAVERSEFGHENIFRVDTREKKFYMQAISNEDMDQWLTHIRTALQTRGGGTAPDSYPDAPDGGGGGADMGGGGGADMGGGGGADTGGGGAGGFGNGPTSPGGDYSQDTPAPREQPTLQHMNDHVTDDMTPDEIHDATEMQRELELQQRELAVQENALRLKEKELVLRQKEMTLELQQQAIDEQLAAMAAQGITVQMPEMPVPPAPAPAPAPVAPPAAAPLGLVAEPEPFVPSEGAQQFTFLVTSDDLFDDQRKCQVLAANLSELEQAMQQKLGVTESLYVLIYDEDFDEYCLPDSLSDVPATGRIKVKRR